MRRLVLALALVGLLAIIVLAPPLFNGFHFGCGAGDNQRSTRLGVVFCRYDAAANVP